MCLFIHRSLLLLKVFLIFIDRKFINRGFDGLKHLFSSLSHFSRFIVTLLLFWQSVSKIELSHPF